LYYILDVAFGTGKVIHILMGLPRREMFVLAVETDLHSIIHKYRTIMKWHQINLSKIRYCPNMMINYVELPPKKFIFVRPHLKLKRCIPRATFETNDRTNDDDMKFEGRKGRDVT